MALLENIILEVDGMLPDLESIFAARKTEAVYFAIRVGLGGIGVFAWLLFSKL